MVTIAEEGMSEQEFTVIANISDEPWKDASPGKCLAPALWREITSLTKSHCREFDLSIDQFTWASQQ